jgi:hypothetical protein
MHIKISFVANYGEISSVETSVYRVKGLKVASTDWPDSPWDCLDLQWVQFSASDENNVPAVLNETSTSSATSCSGNILPVDQEIVQSGYSCGPWEAVPIFDESTSHAKAWKSYVVPTIPPSVCDDILSYLNKLVEENEERYGLFVFEVDPIELPEYSQLIHVPMFLDLIRRRLQKRYYRQVTKS